MRDVLVIAASLVLIGCDDTTNGHGADAPPTADAPATADAAPTADGAPIVFGASGTVVGPGAAAGPVAVVWTVTTGQDYLYKFGDGTSAGTTFMAGLTADPPAMARNQFPQTDVGVGVAILMAPGQSLADGVLASEPAIIGITGQHAVIYRGATDTGAVIPWTTAFPVGLSCGRCVEDPGGGFDTFEPVDCATLVLDTDPAAPVCNWT